MARVDGSDPALERARILANGGGAVVALPGGRRRTSDVLHAAATVRLPSAPPGVTVRMAGAGDWAGVRRCIVALAADMEALGPSQSHPEGPSGEAVAVMARLPEEHWRQAAASHGTRGVFLAERDGAALAVAAGQVRDAALYFGWLWVAPELRSHGVGARLIASLVGWGRRHGATLVTAAVVENNSRAQQLYGRLGAVYTGWGLDFAGDGMTTQLFEAPLTTRTVDRSLAAAGVPSSADELRTLRRLVARHTAPHLGGSEGADRLVSELVDLALAETRAGLPLAEALRLVPRIGPSFEACLHAPWGELPPAAATALATAGAVAPRTFIGAAKAAALGSALLGRESTRAAGRRALSTLLWRLDGGLPGHPLSGEHLDALRSHVQDALARAHLEPEALSRLPAGLALPGPRALSWAEMAEVLRRSARDSGSVQLVAATCTDADALGAAWVGRSVVDHDVRPLAYRESRVVLNADGCRGYRSSAGRGRDGVDGPAAVLLRRSSPAVAWDLRGHIPLTDPLPDIVAMRRRGTAVAGL